MTEIEVLKEQLNRIEQALSQLVQQRAEKEFYSTAEVAEIMDKSEYTIREYCRLGRIQAKKKPCGRGKGGEWLISNEELQKLRNVGPGPAK